VSLSKDNFRKLSSFKAKNGCSLASWLRQVSINLTIDYMRRLKPTVSLDEQDSEGHSLSELIVDSRDSAVDQAEKSEKLTNLKECVKGLENTDKVLLEFHFFARLSLESLKNMLQISRGQWICARPV